MKNIFKKIWNAFTSLLVIGVLLLAMLLGAPRLLHIQALVVQSGSMEPVFMTGSLIYVQEVEASELEVGDVITFSQEETIVTHRIIEIVETSEVPGGIAYRTKGDANEMEDANLVPPENVIGKALFGIPYLGYLAGYIQKPPGLYIAIVIGAGLILLMFFPDLFKKEQKIKEEPEKPVKNKKRKKPKKKKRPVAQATVEKPRKKRSWEDLSEEERRKILERRRKKQMEQRKAQKQMEEQ